MKEMKAYFLWLFMIFFLFSCFWWNSDEVIDAKKWLGIITQDNSWVTDDSIPSIDTWDLLDVLPDNTTSSGNISENKNIEINYLTDNKFLELDDLSWKDLLSWEVEITWKTLINVDKIIIKFSNKESDYPDDNFTLKQYKPWDKTFLYRAFSRYETLDFWKNEYIIEAYSWDEVSKLLLIINLENEKVLDKVELLDIKNLPVWWDFGDPKELWDWNITYSDLKWLEIKKIVDNFFECDINIWTDNYYVSEYLDKINDSYYWWNTCRPFEKDNWISYFVLKLDQEDYKYEKHIFLKNWIYWIYELDSWSNLVLKEDSVQEKNIKLKAKNDELKEKHDEYINLDIINNLFKNLTNN